MADGAAVLNANDAISNDAANDDAIPDDAATDAAVAAFIAKWRDAGGAETANSQSFLKELCGLLGVEPPRPSVADDEANDYVFEKRIAIANGDGTESVGFADLYKAGCFVLESKQGIEKDEAARPLSEAKRARKRKAGHAVRGTPAWTRVMEKAKRQARRYARNAPPEHGWPVFLVVCDVGHCLDLFADFSRSGRTYEMFPDPRRSRIRLDDLADPAVRRRLRLVWTDPARLDPSRHAAAVTQELAEKLAELARRLESADSPDVVAAFLMRCLFTMFAEDVGLFGLTESGEPTEPFTRLLGEMAQQPDQFAPMLESLWGSMDEGGFSPVLRQTVRRFNGSFFKPDRGGRQALPLDADQIALLREAAAADWAHVEPAIFGTLIERALDPVERHKLGAHYTPRAYVERLVEPTILEPLRADWEGTLAAAAAAADEGDRKAAETLVRDFHAELCGVRVLDPACGSGNFLYVSLELMKRLEGEVIAALAGFGGEPPLATIDPQNFLGIEINPRAAKIAELVLWIGYLKWHFAARGYEAINDPILHDYATIECRDAVLAYDERVPKVDADGEPVTHWDGRTTKPHPVTGEPVPDETARIPEYEYVNPRKAEWPEADFIVGNPPFLGASRMRDALGDGYAETIRDVYDKLSSSCDFVMYWWWRGALRVSNDHARRSGLITTNSLRQSFNRRIVDSRLAAKKPVSIVFGVPDHPWVDAGNGADVRIAMTVVRSGAKQGRICRVVEERSEENEDALRYRREFGVVRSNLAVGADTSSAIKLRSNEELSCPGVKLHGAGFIVEGESARSLRDRLSGEHQRMIRRYRNGRDLSQTPRGVSVIDLTHYTQEQVRRVAPLVYQHVLETVRPGRVARADKGSDARQYAETWWRFGKTRDSIRKLLDRSNRYIATPETTKHRFFVFLESEILPDNMVIAIALEESAFFGVLSSRLHVTWSLALGGRLGVGNDPRYNKTRCFETFPFPDPDDATRARIAELGEQLDAHRKRQQAAHPDLTMTGMYNVLEKLRADEPLDEKEKTIHEQGLVSVLRQIHDDLDAAVMDAYGWPRDLEEEEILQRLVDLNAERAAEEARGHIRWLRPEFQDPNYGQEPAETQTQAKLIDAPPPQPAAKPAKRDWPKTLPERLRALRETLAAAGPLPPDEVPKQFKGAKKATVAELVEALEAVGQAWRLEDGRLAA